MNDSKKAIILTKMSAYGNTLKDLLHQIQKIEDDKLADVSEKLSKIKKIKEEITKVGIDIDNAKKELTLIDSYNVN